MISLLLLAVLVASVLMPPGFRDAPGQSSPRALASARDPYAQPFASDSIWNLPVGANAVYVPAHIAPATGAGMTTDPDVIILTPTAPMTNVYYNGDGWSGGSRCRAQGGVLFSGPIPGDFVVPGASHSSTPNFATAILMPDNHTLAQGQPMARCTANGTATMMWYQETEDLYGPGFSGAHGGSDLSSIGGTIRLGELVPGSAIRHAMKVNLNGAQDYFYDAATAGYRWPATTADSYASSVYGGSVAALRMGSLLALPPTLNLSKMGFETQAAQILAVAFQDYGAYTVDDAGWPVYAIETEFSPNGHVEDQFQQAWGFSMTPSALDTPWARDMNRIFSNLSVVDNWNAAAWQTVAASNGTQGAGGGAPRVPWAPPLRSSGTPGSVSLTSPAGGAVFNPGESVRVAWSSSGSLLADSVSLSFSANGGATWGSPFGTGEPLVGSSIWQVPNILTSQGMVRAVASDPSGNPVEGRSGIFTIQNYSTTGSPIARQVHAPLWPQPNAVLTFNASYSSPSAANATLQARWDWQGDGAWDTSWSSNLVAQHTYAAEGNYTVILEVLDSTGLTDNATASVIVDSTPPTTTAAVSGSLGTGDWYQTLATVTLTASDPGSGVAVTHYRVDGGAWQDYALPFFVDDGRHAVDFDSTDRAGNVEPVHTLTVSVDHSPPVFHTVSPHGVVSTSPVLVSWNATDPASTPIDFRTSVDGGPFVDRGANTSASFVLSDGDHLVLVRAIDLNNNTADATISFRIDTSASGLLGPYAGVVLGGGIAAALFAALLIILWRRGPLRKRLDEKWAGTRGTRARPPPPGGE